MKLLENIFDKIRPPFEEGKPLHFAYPLFEGAESFFLTSAEVTKGKTHIRDFLDIKRLMILVVMALLPCSLMAIYNTGFQGLIASGKEATLLPSLLFGALAFLPIYIVTLVVGGFWEVLFCIVRRHEISEGFLVTSLLFPLILPPTIPLWQVAVGISFGVVIGKEVFGGVGMNILNPALTGRAFLFFTYPGEMSGQKVWFFQFMDHVQPLDSLTGATPLATSALPSSALDALHQQGYTWWKMFVGLIPGSMGETSALACLIGAVILVLSKVGSWRTMLGCVIGAWVSLFLLKGFCDLNHYPLLSLPIHYHLVMGGFAFGAVFMATDPVTSASTKTGKWIYGISIGFLAMVIRNINPAYPEGMMLAILLMNVFAPLIDHFVSSSNINRRLQRGKK